MAAVAHIRKAERNHRTNNREGVTDGPKRGLRNVGSPAPTAVLDEDLSAPRTSLGARTGPKPLAETGAVKLGTQTNEVGKTFGRGLPHFEGGVRKTAVKQKQVEHGLKYRRYSAAPSKASQCRRQTLCMAWEIEKDVLYPRQVVVPGPGGTPLVHKFTDRELAAINATGNAKIGEGWNIPIVWEHQDEKPDRRKMLKLSQSERDREYARGVFGAATRFVLRDGHLRAVLAGDDDEDLKQFKKIKYVSPEIEWDWRDSDGKVWHGPTITHIAATPRPVQRHQSPVQLSQNHGKQRLIPQLGDFIEQAARVPNVGGTINPFVIRLSLNDYAEAPKMADDEQDMGGEGEKKGNWCQRIVAALMGVGIKLPDCSQQKDPEHFADLIETACLNADQGPTDEELLPEKEEETDPTAGDMEQPPPGTETPPGPPIQMGLRKQQTEAIDLGRKNLTVRIGNLERERRVTPATAEDLRGKLKTVRLSLRKDGNLEDNAVLIRVEAFEQNAPGSAYGLKADRSDKPPTDRWVMKNGRRVRLSLKTPRAPEYSTLSSEDPATVADTLDAWDKTGAKS